MSTNHPATQPQDEIDQRIQLALQMIGSANPPEGLQARVLRRTRHLPDEPATAFRFGSWRIAAVTCLLLIASGAAIGRYNRAVAREEAGHALLLNVSASPSPGGRQATRTQRATPHSIPNGRAPRKLTYVSTRKVPAKPRGMNEPATRDAAYAEMLAPSKPAPEMPLTRQERLLLAAAHRREQSEQVAELRRPVWPLHDPEDDDNFEQFFQHPMNTNPETMNEAQP